MSPRMTFVTLLLFAELALSFTAGMLGGELAIRIGMVAALTLPLLLLLRAPAGTPRISFSVRDRRAWLSLLLLPAFVLITAAISLGWGALLTALGLTPRGATPMPTWTGAILLDALLPAVCEELLCRGAIYSTLRPMGRRTAVLGSALLFGLMHASLAQLPYAVAAGILLALLYEWSGSLLFPMLFHLGNNLLSLLVHFTLTPVQFFLLLGAATLLTLPLFFIAARRARIPLPERESANGDALREFFLSPVVLYLAITLSLTFLSVR